MNKVVVDDELPFEGKEVKLWEAACFIHNRCRSDSDETRPHRLPLVLQSLMWMILNGRLLAVTDTSLLLKWGNSRPAIISRSPLPLSVSCFIVEHPLTHRKQDGRIPRIPDEVEPLAARPHSAFPFPWLSKVMHPLPFNVSSHQVLEVLHSGGSCLSCPPVSLPPYLTDAVDRPDRRGCPTSVASVTNIDLLSLFASRTK